MLYRAAAILATVASLSHPLAANASEWVLPPGSSVDGKTSAQLSADWWQWAESIPHESNPVRDLTGENCGVGQQGEVWFLAGGFGSSKIRRSCTIPQGNSVFFPVINMVYWRRGSASTLTCDQAKEFSALNNETALDLFVELDGVPIADVKQYRSSSQECFDVYGRIPKDQRPYDAYPSASDGYWILLKPLPAGRHTLRFGGRYNQSSGAYGRMVQDIEYELIVQ
jgi:hypothetical protein